MSTVVTAGLENGLSLGVTAVPNILPPLGLEPKTAALWPKTVPDGVVELNRLVVGVLPPKIPLELEVLLPKTGVADTDLATPKMEVLLVVVAVVKTSEVVVVPKARVEAEPAAGVVAVPKAGVVSEPKAGVVAEPKAGVVAEPRAGVVAVPKASVVAVPKAGVVVVPKAGVVAVVLVLANTGVETAVL